MRIPAKPPRDVVTLHGPVSWNDVLDGGCQHVSVMRQTGRKGRAIVENIGRFIFGELNLCVQVLVLLYFQEIVTGRLLLTWRSKALISRHFSMMASSSLGKSMDIMT
jgi:hypothetical protein